MENIFFTFIKPYVAFIDKGDFFRKPFSWLYILLALLNLVLPLYILYSMIDMGVFTFLDAKGIFGLILLWLGIAFACWLGFQLWWNRKDKVLFSTEKNDDFVAIPGFSNFIQTTGEWAGMMIAIIGCWSSIVALLFGQTTGMLGLISDKFMDINILSIFLFPIQGFLIVVASRVIAEVIRALASIANNTRK